MATAPPPANICICQAFYCKSQKLLGFPCDSAGKESTCNAGDLRSIPGLGRSPGKGKGYPLQYSGLENSVDCIVHGAAKSQTRLSSFHFPRSPNPATHTHTPPPYQCWLNLHHQSLKTRKAGLERWWVPTLGLGGLPSLRQVFPS